MICNESTAITVDVENISRLMRKVLFEPADVIQALLEKKFPGHQVEVHMDEDWDTVVSIGHVIAILHTGPYPGEMGH